MRGRDGKGGGKEHIPTLREVVQPGSKAAPPPNLDLFEDPPAATEPAAAAGPDEAERLRQAFIEELDRRVENLIRSRVQRLADSLAEDVMKTLKREIRNIAKDQERP
ncbi:hypothetical protein [Natronospira bacteriovora]|uniref:Uncharacterized protein n=1 Tax=Natronospira bacteriovora TaxID=3069753 RepID=A0ABU0W5W6_9GAMM|nr:hypothetical protein [Natronospira sp. AB-CW4]MDQ2069412.1 hypothetical protein [Natronospira sp. AB-CW4]